MRGMSPPGRRTWGSRRDVASSPRRPPPLSVTTGTPYASAVSAADSTSAVSPEYDTATTRASLPGARGRPYPRCTRMGTSSRGRTEAARRSAPLAEPPIPAMMISDGRTRGRGGSLRSACASRHCAGKALRISATRWGSPCWTARGGWRGGRAGGAPPRGAAGFPWAAPAPRHGGGGGRGEPVSHLDGCLTDRDRLLDAHGGPGASGERDGDGAALRPRRATKRLG